MSSSQVSSATQPLATPVAVSAAGGVEVTVEALVRTDLGLEAALAQVRHRPSSLAGVVGWSLRGRSALIEQVAATGALDVASLPYDEAVLAQLRAAREQGRPVTLRAGAIPQAAAAVASHLSLFDTVIDSAAVADTLATANVNEVLRPSPRQTSQTARAALKALRPHQWTKNALVFLPALLAHSVGTADVWVRALWAFCAFSVCASSVYVLNDLLDLHADRAHHRKKNRPFASGTLPLGFGLLLAPLLLGSAFALAFTLSPRFAGVLGIYYVATLAYSLWLKRQVLVDVMVLAGLYTVRLIAGGIAYSVIVSQWLLAFSMFLFLSLAFVKRYSEVHLLRKKGLEEAAGRGYRASDLEQLSSLGASAGFISVLVLALYVNSQDVTRLYTHPERLWAMLPLLLYWVSRVWLIAHRGQMHDDPIVFAIGDKVSYVVAALVVAAVWLAV